MIDTKRNTRRIVEIFLSLPCISLAGKRAGAAACHGKSRNPLFGIHAFTGGFCTKTNSEETERIEPEPGTARNECR